MRVTEWLRGRGVGVPPTLEVVLSARLEGADGTSETDVTDGLVQAATAQLTHVLHTRPMSRAQALDLLAADAFATYAFEAAADEPETLVARANAAMQAFAVQVES